MPTCSASREGPLASGLCRVLGAFFNVPRLAERRDAFEHGKKFGVFSSVGSSSNSGQLFSASTANPIYEIAEWVSAAYEFHDRELQSGFEHLRKKIASFVEIVLERLHAMDANPNMAWPLTDMDRTQGVQPQRHSRRRLQTRRQDCP